MKLSEETVDLSPYDFGRTPSTACGLDPRFSYCLYVPRGLNAGEANFLVAIHGTERNNQSLRDLFAPLADELGLIVIAPLFPAGIEDPLDRDNYKYIKYRGIRFDSILFSMIDDVAHRYGVDPARFSLFGFSGGAHFAHRFFYLHPERLSAVSICAPGSPTMLDETRCWWVGLADMADHFGRSVNLPAMREVPIHLAVGAEDLDTWEITHKPGTATWMEGANDAGATRVDRLAALERSLLDAGIPVSTDIVPGVRHERDALAAKAMTFFRDTLRG